MPSRRGKSFLLLTTCQQAVIVAGPGQWLFRVSLYFATGNGSQAPSLPSSHTREAHTVVRVLHSIMGAGEPIRHVRFASMS